MNVVSLFDGMSCGRLALNKIGVTPTKYVASEIDSYAIKVAKENFPDTIQVGDVSAYDFYSMRGEVDLLIGGSPCQGFSTSGKGLAFNDPRSRLFFEYVRVMKELRPKYFLLENVKMKKEYQDVITQYLGVQPIEINSALVSAQNRRRLYWTNIPVTQPEDKNIFLKDILEEEPENAVYLSETAVKRFMGYGLNFLNGTEKKARCLSAMEYVKNGKQGNYVIQILRPRGNNPGGIRATDGKSLPITTSSFEQNVFVGVGGEEFKVRKLTVKECKRLQTVPDDYAMNVSNSQAYKMLGNGWTIDVIAHILKGMSL